MKNLSLYQYFDRSEDVAITKRIAYLSKKSLCRYKYIPVPYFRLMVKNKCVYYQIIILNSFQNKIWKQNAEF